MQTASIVVQGAGFERSETYACIFQGIGNIHGEVLYASAIVLSSNRLTCTSPSSNMTLMWSIGDMKASFSITANGLRMSFTGSNPTKTEFLYTVLGWSRAFPLEHYTTGGSVLTVTGQGFRTSGHLYEAVFSAGKYHNSSKCAFLSSTQIKCPIPGPIRL